jgi:hypothetical protein
VFFDRAVPRSLRAVGRSIETNRRRGIVGACGLIEKTFRKNRSLSQPGRGSYQWKATSWLAIGRESYPGNQYRAKLIPSTVFAASPRSPARFIKVG